jgi:large subunit ribosomal protein L7/L12
MVPGKLGAPGMAPGKLGVPGAIPGKLGAPGMTAGKLGVPGAMNQRVGVYLVNAGQRRIGVMKVIRQNTGLGLRESKNIIDTPNAAVKVGLTMAQANALRAQLMAAGAQVTIR